MTCASGVLGAPSLPRYARGLLVRVALDRHGRELLRKSQAEITQLMRRREELGEGTRGQLEIEKPVGRWAMFVSYCVIHMTSTVAEGRQIFIDTLCEHVIYRMLQMFAICLNDGVA